jgi:hypothetical protein
MREGGGRVICICEGATDSKCNGSDSVLADRNCGDALESPGKVEG